MPEPIERPDDQAAHGLPDDAEGTGPTTRLDDGPAQADAPPQPPYAADEPRSASRHPVKIGYLVAGLLALGLALVWLLAETGVVERPAGDGVGVSLVLIAAGLAGLLASLGRAARRRT